MKKTLIALACLFFAANVNAQQKELNYSGFRLGLTAHPNFGFIKAEGGKGNGTSLGFSYGLLGDFNFAENYSFATGLTITTINGKSTEVNATPYHVTGAATQGYDLKYMMQYLEIPLTIKLKTGDFNGIRWFGQFGLSNDFRLSARQDAESNGASLAKDASASSWTRFYRAGMIIGAGGEFSVSDNTSIMAGLTLNNGFTNITDNSYTVKNHFVAINLGVFF